MSLVSLVVLNELNLSYLNGSFPYKDGLITTADEYSYFAPADTFYEHFRWAESPNGKPAIMRPPGYGIIYLFTKVLGGSNAFFLLKIVQIILFGGSVLMLSKVLQLLRIRENLNVMFTAIYGFLPFFSGFVYYTLSESVVPFFVVWSLVNVLRQHEDKQFSWSTVLSLSALLLIRPQLVVLPMMLLSLFFFKGQRKVALSVLLSFIPLLLWNVRTFSMEGKISSFHPIYSVSNNSLYRPPHEAMTDLFRVWDYRGDIFHGNMALLSRDTLVSTRDEVMHTIPVKYHQTVEPVLMKFQRFRLLQRENYAGKKVDTYLPGEMELVQQINQVRSELIHQYPFDHYIKTPVLSAKRLLGTSMMNLYIFQDPWRDNVCIIGLKFLSFGLILTGLLALVATLLFHTNVVLRLTALSVLLTLIYLCFFQRFNEERYLTPYLSLLVVMIAIQLHRYLPVKN